MMMNRTISRMEDEDKEEGHSPGCRSMMPRPCRGRPRRAPAWECTGNRNKHSPEPREGSSSSPEPRPSAGCHKDWAGSGFLSLCPPISAGRGARECFTFRIGARKTEIPVSTKTMMPVTLCSLEWGQEQDQPLLCSPRKEPQGHEWGWD